MPVSILLCCHPFQTFPIFLISFSNVSNTIFQCCRSASLPLQDLISTRLVTKIDSPNLLLDQAVQWNLNPIFTPRLNSCPAGWQQFGIGDRGRADQLGLPRLSGSEGEHLLVLATGSYGIRRAQVTLTAAREYELKDERARTGSLTNYNILASQAPQSTQVLYCRQESIPPGYSEAVYGAWAGPVLILKCMLPSSHKAPIRPNLHTVTLLISTVPVPVSRLGLTGALTRLIGYICTCKAGPSTNRACAQVVAACIALLAPDCFQTVKKKTGRLTDINLPRAHQPTVTGNSFLYSPITVIKGKVPIKNLKSYEKVLVLSNNASARLYYNGIMEVCLKADQRNGPCI